MPDNIPISPGQGAVIATDQDPATGAHYQRVKLVDGTEGSSDPVQTDGKGSLNVHSTDNDLLSDGSASVKVVNGPDEVLHVRIAHQGRSQSGSCVPVVLASDHDPVPIASANLPLLGGALAANGAIWGPIPLAGANGLTLQIAGTYNLTIIFEATVADPVLGPWVTVGGCRTTNGQLDSNPAINSLNVAWDFMLSGFAYFRVRVTAFSSGLAQLQASRYTNATEPSPSVVAHGMSTGGSPVALACDSSGRQMVMGLAAVGAAGSYPVFVAGGDGTSNGYQRQPTAAIDGTPQNGQTTNQPTFLLIGGVDGVPVVSPSYAAPNLSMVGTARKLLTDSIGVLQVTDGSITLLRQELRETNALLFLILQALAGTDALDIKGGVRPAQLPVQ